MSGDETRERILGTAWDLVRRDGTAVRMADVAAASGVSRQMVYLHFSDRAGLLTALARYHDRTSGFVDRMAAVHELPPLESFERYVREWCDYLPAIMPVARQLYAAALTGTTGAEAWSDRMEVMHRGLRNLMRRLDAAGHLAPGWSVESAAQWAYGRLGVATYQAMTEDCGWTHEDFSERTVRSLRSELLLHP